MLVDINLLPKKEKKALSLFSFSALLTALTVLVVGTGGFFYWSQVQDVQSLDQRVFEQLSLNQSLQHELEGGEEAKHAQVIQTISEQLITNTADLMSEIQHHVPNNGELNAFKLGENQIDLTITTMTNEQAVQFYQKLQKMNFYKVVIHTINYEQSQNYFTTNYTIYLEANEEGGNGS